MPTDELWSQFLPVELLRLVAVGDVEIRVRLEVLEQHALAVLQADVTREVRIHQRHPLLLYGGRIGLGGDGHVERAIRRLQVLRHVDVRNLQRVAVRVEAMRHAIRGQAGLQHDAGEIEQIAHGVLVLAPRQPTERRAIRGIDVRLLGLEQRVLQPLLKASRGGFRRALLFLRRHLARRDAIVDLHPASEGVAIEEIRVQRGEVEVAFLALAVVAIEAIRLEVVGGRAFASSARGGGKPQRAGGGE